MASSLSGIASQILQATATPSGHSILPGFLIRPLAALATTDSSGRQGKGVSAALVREAVALYDASRKRSPSGQPAPSDWRFSSDVGQAVQVLPPVDDLQRRAFEQVERRMQTLTLNHPRLAPILQVAYQEGYPYLVARLGTEFERLSRLAGLPLEPDRAFYITEQVLDALKYAHYSGFVHGSLSLDDVLVNEENLVTVLGVGLAQLRSMTGAQASSAPTALSAPEASEDEPVGTSADVYAVGALLFYLLTGQAPKPGYRVKISRAVDGVPAAVDDVLTRALETDPADRYPGLNELSHDLRIAMRGARRPRPIGVQAPPAEPPAKPAARPVDRIAGFPDPLPMPELDMSVFASALVMPTFEAIPVVEMPEIPQIPEVDWNALLQPVDVSGYSNHKIELPTFGDLDTVDPFQAAAKAARDAERVAASRATRPPVVEAPSRDRRTRSRRQIRKP